ncbi:HlyD family type I secretion periplasmic adaptor subunit [Larsenimonas rhizosphaerae]|uniref:HlyD family type I secretion periplasmic adaptor subunit n=1 Tax=Larsenimonas rhizosphaerae TaxID=2944682 RepID=UPI0020338600|nr:HlyD family type I secretion periplasmic adaptor subunit [Larsenimonas rhizosphaerae]MCM2129927.1 HlyD family type I secretion periplasmic adaptor subunit [Larsenimonas rhizosphaerae]
MARNTESVIEREDIHYLDDASAAVLLATPWKSRFLIWLLLAFMGVALGWAALAQVEVVTRGTGEIVPSTRLQTIQNLEGGIIRDLLVSEGDVVDAGQPLARIDDTRAGADLAERESTLSGLHARIAQLEAELASVVITPDAADWQGQVSLELHPLALDDAFRAANPSLSQSASAAYRERIGGLRSQLSQSREQITQRQQELRELDARVASLNRSYQLARQELSITAPLVREGVVSRVDLLQIQRNVNDLRGDLESARLAIPAKQSEFEEAISRRLDVARQFRVKSADALSEARGTLDSQRQGRSSLRDRVDRTLVTSPVHGTVRSINITTIGGVIEPGQSLMEIVPIEDKLLVNARVLPRDIGFLQPGQPATIKLSAYDFTIYGGLNGTVERISPDTVQDEEGNSFYQVRIRTNGNHLGSDADPLPIIPGMQVTADIITGEQTILQYLLKPILRARQGALRER